MSDPAKRKTWGTYLVTKLREKSKRTANKRVCEIRERGRRDMKDHGLSECRKGGRGRTKRVSQRKELFDQKRGRGSI